MDASSSKRMKTNVSPTKLKLRRKIKALNQKVRRRNKKVSSLKGLIKQLKVLLENEACDTLENHFDGTLNDLFKNELINKLRKVTGKRYSKH